jgi:DNA-directed RNA polymerase specialized sigma24 family protein
MNAIRKGNWDLTQPAFERLLLKLDSDRRRAGQKYESLRNKLTYFFTCRGVLAPEDHADEVLDRLGRKLEEGVEVENVAAYSASIARRYWKELLRKQAREKSCLVDGALLLVAESRDLVERRAGCVEGCWEKLSDHSRRMMSRYCAGDWWARVASRREMSKALGVSPTALRIRVHRIRTSLEKCVLKCVDTKQSKKGSGQ